MTAEQGQVQTNPELRILLRQRHGFGAIGFIHHQARRGEDAVAMRADDRLIDRARATEVVGVDDEASQWRGGGHARAGSQES